MITHFFAVIRIIYRVHDTVNLRKNAGNAGPTLSIGASGIFNDNTDTYTAAATDAMSYQIVTGSTGTSISI